MDIFKLVGSIFIKNEDANKEIDETTKKASELASKVGSSMQKAGNTVTSVGKKLAPVSAVFAGALTMSTKSASDFQNSMAKMSTLFDTTKVDVSKLSQEFVTLSNKTGLASTELAEAGYQALSAGIDVEKSVGFVETASNLARAGFTSTTTAVDVLTTAINAYGFSADKAESISNKLVKTQNLGKTTVDELASSMGKIIPTASAMNVDINNLTSGYVTLTKQGIATAESTTYMNSMLNELGKSSTIVGGILQEKTGKSFQELMADGNSLADVLAILQNHADETGTGFNELWGSAEAGKAGLAILNSGVDEFDNTLKTMKSETDDVGEALDKLDTPSVKLQRSLNRVKNTGIELGTSIITALTPTIEKLASGVEKVTNWFNSLDEKTKTNIATAMGFVAVLSPVLMIGGKIISGIGTVITVFSKMTGIIKAGVGIVKGLGSALGFLTSPVGIVIAVIGALVAGFIYLWNNCEGFRQFWIDLWENIKQIASDVVDAVVGFFTGLWDSITSIWDSIVEAVSSAWDTICNVIQVAGMLIVSLVEALFTLITLPFRFIWENCKDIIIEVWDAISSWLSDCWNTISSVATTVFTAISDFFSGIWNAIKTATTTAWNAIKNFLSPIWNTIKSVATTVFNAVSNFISNAWNAIKSVTTTVWNAISETVKGVWDTIKSAISGAIDSVKSTIQNGLNTAKEIISGILDGIKEKFTSIFDGAKEIVSNAIEKIKGFFNFSWSLPKLKMPHFSIEGSFSLNPPSVPHLAVDWYKKAMDNPFMFTNPTLFGVNSAGQPMGAGDAGDEVMIGKNTMLNMIQTAVASEIRAIVDSMDAIADRISESMTANGQQGDIVIPVYIGNDMVDEIIVNSKKRLSIRSGGLVNV